MANKKKRVKKQLKKGKKNRDTKVSSSKLTSLQMVTIGLLAGGAFLFSGGNFADSAFKVIAQNTYEDLHLPTAMPVIQHESYTVAYDVRTKTPSWVYEHLTPENLNRRVSHKGHSFESDPYMESSLQASLGDFRRSGYQKGFLSSPRNHCTSYGDVEQTHYLTNVAPQDPWFAKGIWSDLEAHIREIAAESYNLYVVSGALFLPGECADGTRYVQYEVIGEHDVGVPTHYYKVLLAEGHEGDFMMKAYLLPNEAVSSDVSFDEFEISVQEIEQLSGLVFFNQLDPEISMVLKN